MSHVLKSNVMHNGKSYAKGLQIKKGDEGFDVLVDLGHAVPVGEVLQQNLAGVAMQPADEAEQQPAEPIEPVKPKSKK